MSDSSSVPDAPNSLTPDSIAQSLAIAFLLGHRAIDQTNPQEWLESARELVTKCCETLQNPEAADHAKYLFELAALQLGQVETLRKAHASSNPG